MNPNDVWGVQFLSQGVLTRGEVYGESSGLTVDTKTDWSIFTLQEYRGGTRTFKRSCRLFWLPLWNEYSQSNNISYVESLLVYVLCVSCEFPLSVSRRDGVNPCGGESWRYTSGWVLENFGAGNPKTPPE